jgi:MFS transporter, PPP family, 3-phenylpropionic acid transporter
MTDSTNNTPPETQFRRRVALCALLFCTVGAWGFIEPLTALFLKAKGLQKWEIGIVTGIGTGGALLIQPLLGRWVDRSRRVRLPMAVAALAAALGYLLFPYANGVLAFTLLTALGVNGFLFLNVASAVIAGHLAREGQGGAAYASYRVWGSIGYIFVALGAGLLTNGRPDDAPTLARIFHIGPLLFVVAALLTRFLPDAAPSPTPVGHVPPKLRAFFVAQFLYFFAFTGMLSMLSLYLASLGAAPLMVSGVWAAGVVAEVWMMLKIGKWSDKNGRRPALLASFCALPLRCLLLIPAASPLWVLGVQLSEAFCYGIIGIVAVAYLNDVTPGEARGAAQAKLAGVNGLAMCCGPLCAGFIAEAWSIRALFASMAAVAFAAALVLWKGTE